MAVTYLPDAVVSGKAHDEAVAGFCESGIKLAEIRVQEGKYAEAEAICRELLSDVYDPNCRPAMALLARLREPGQINKTMGPKFIGKVEEVRKLLIDADGYYNSGRYDLAFKKYEQILNLDPYNTAARRGQEKINNQKTRYGEEAYNETRSRAVWQVQQGWENPVRRYGEANTPVVDAFARDASGTARISNKLATIIIPKIDFRDASIREAMDFLRQQAAANDPSEEGRKGVDIVLRLNQIGTARAGTGRDRHRAAPGGRARRNRRRRATRAAARGGRARACAGRSAGFAGRGAHHDHAQSNPARRSAALCGQPGRFEGESGTLRRLDYSGERTEQRHVHEGIPGTAGLHQRDVELGCQRAGSTRAGERRAHRHGQGHAGIDGRPTVGHARNGEGFALRPRRLVPAGRERQFPPAKQPPHRAQHAGQSRPRGCLVEQANVSGPKQVEIEAKFVEITQNNLKELGFDWLLGQFNIGNQARLRRRRHVGHRARRRILETFPSSPRMGCR